MEWFPTQLSSRVPSQWTLLLLASAGLLVRCPLQGQTLPDPMSTGQSSSLPVRPASLEGVVIDRDGALIRGVQLRLEGSGGYQSTAISDDSGFFALTGVPPGDVHLTATLTGFTTVEQQLVLAPGATLRLAPTVMPLATIHVEVEAVTAEQAGIEEVHAEEHQRLLGVLPNFFVSYTWTAPPLTTRQKFALATHTVLDPGNLGLVGVTAGVQQAANAFPGYGQGAAGYGKRYGADAGNLVIGTYLGGAVLPTLFRQDPRYFYKGTGTMRSRALYAISRAFICRGNNGRDEVNFSSMLGDLSSGALSNLYYPASDRQGATLTLENGLLSIAGDMMNNVVQEFVLDHITFREKK